MFYSSVTDISKEYEAIKDKVKLDSFVKCMEHFYPLIKPNKKYVFSFKNLSVESQTGIQVEIEEPMEPTFQTSQYNRHQVACLLAEATGDDCACNVGYNDEWLSYCCDFKDTCKCNVVGVACWEQYLKHLDEKRKYDEEN